MGFLRSTYAGDREKFFARLRTRAIDRSAQEFWAQCDGQLILDQSNTTFTLSPRIANAMKPVLVGEVKATEIVWYFRIPLCTIVLYCGMTILTFYVLFLSLLNSSLPGVLGTVFILFSIALMFVLGTRIGNKYSVILNMAIYESIKECGPVVPPVV